MSRIDLSGTWSLTCGKDGFQPIPAQIPGENCSALIEAGLAADPYIAQQEDDIQWVRDYDWTWTRLFEVDAAFLKQKRIWLNVDSLDTVGEIKINGHSVVNSRNMFCRIRQDVKDFLREGRNEIEVVITAVEKYTSEIAAKQRLDIGNKKSYWRKMPNNNFARKIQCQGGWDWGPCIPVSGIYGEIYLDGSNGIRIEHIYTEQAHTKGECTLYVTAEIEADFEGTQDVAFAFDGVEKIVPAKLHAGLNFVKSTFTVKNPRLWYPVGYGEQPLYELSVVADACSVQKKIGLRDLKTISHEDEHGICLYFQVNGVPVFAKGADWIPMDARPQNYTRQLYEALLSDVVAANMNVLRVWGGGLYENEDFYDICDEKGILLWHDCMFACAQYPSDDDFLDLVRAELNYQVKRLRDHACIALWCGDNECGGFLQWAGQKDLPLIMNYDRFNQAVGRAVKAADNTRAFWPTSPCNSLYDASGWDDDSKGDMHFWKVWHSGADMEAYYNITPRFCSEFGYQSFPSQNTVDIYTQGRQRNVTSPLMEHHQRNTGGNSKIVEMFTRYFRFPATFEDFIYLSQVQQAVAIKTGVEYWRTLRPVCMGTIYWQLNDNWPVASWASLDYFRNWKQLHYHAKRFYAPVMVTAIRKTPDAIELRMANDMDGVVKGNVKLCVYDVNGTKRQERTIAAEMPAFSGGVVETLPIAELTQAPAEDFICLEFAGECKGQKIDFRNECFFSKYKAYNFQTPDIRRRLYCDANGELHLELSTDVPAFYVFAEIKGSRAVFSDNSFTLLPDAPRDLKIAINEKMSLAEVEQRLVIRHLRGSYQE
ncbi:MAG: glycoside hydrolase family 2 protein [Victivallales bacterium]|nr:glycoside hydrolase family 2 protein [Victivallales bacterium]